MYLLQDALGEKPMPKPVDLLQGTLDMLILKAVSLGPLHGYGVLLRIQQISSGRLEIQQGSLYPALFRLEHQGLIAGEWGESENKRRAKVLLAHSSGAPSLPGADPRLASHGRHHRWRPENRAGGVVTPVLRRRRLRRRVLASLVLTRNRTSGV